MTEGHAARSLRSVAHHLLALVATTALAAAHTWPLLPLRKTHLVGGAAEDPWMNVWHLDWVRRSIVEGKSPFFAPDLHWPLGAELYWHTLSPAKSIWGLLVPWLGAVQTLNLVVFFTFVLTGMTAWWLMRDVLRRAGHTGTLADVAAFAGACVFDFSRYHLCHAHAHVNLSALEGIPLFLLCALRWFETRRTRWLVASGFAALYVAGCDFYYVYYLALFCIFYVVALEWRRGRLFSRKTLRSPLVQDALRLGAVSAVACLPLVTPMLLHMRPAPLAIHHGDSDYGADPLMLVCPDVFSAWFKALPSFLAEPIRKMQAGTLNDEEGGLFLGVATPVLAAIALRARVLPVRPWLEIAIAFAVLSFGPYLYGGGIDALPAQAFVVLVAAVLWCVPAVRRSPRGREVAALVTVVALVTFATGVTAEGRAATVKIPMPYLFFKHLVPLFGRGGMPVRFLVMTQLCLGVLVALGTLHLGKRLGARSAPAALAVALALVAAVNVDTANRPFAMTEVPRLPAVFDAIRDDPETIAVYTDHVVGQWEQLYHRRPVSFARQSRLPVRERPLVESPLYRALVEFRRVDPSAEEADAMRAWLRENHFKYFVGHRRAIDEAIAWRKMPADSGAARTRLLIETLGGAPVYRDDYVEVVRFW